MNNYDLTLFNSLTINELVEKFPSSTINDGSIDVFGDTIGKPGDIVYSLKNIEVDGNTLKFEFGETEVVIFNPINIIVNEKVIGVSDCSKVIWSNGNSSFEYLKEGDSLNTRVLKGEHFFKTKQNREAFLFYTW
jgi:hypothetical protein